VTTPSARPRTPVRYRVVAYELRAGTETVQEHLADLIADEPPA
jgi:hypothetical protein